MMHTQRDGAAPVSAGAAPVEAPDATSQKHQTFPYPTRTDQIRHPRTYDAPLRTWTDILAFFIFAALIVATAFIALYALLAVLFVLGQMVAS